MDLLENLNEHHTWGDITQGKFVFYPSVTREDYTNTGRITDAIYDGAFIKRLVSHRLIEKKIV